VQCRYEQLDQEHFTTNGKCIGHINSWLEHRRFYG